MVTGGNVTVFVSSMDTAVKFYTDTLGLRLRERYGDHWASVEAGNGLIIGLHPASAENPAGRRGSVSIGFAASGPIEQVVEALTKRGVRFEGGVTNDKGGKFVGFGDPDGNPCYLYEPRADYVEPEPAKARG